MTPSVILKRMLTDPDWAPPGGTSNRRYREIRAEFDPRWLTALRERVAADPRLWIKEYSGFSTIYVGWNDDPMGGYAVVFGLRHQVEQPPEALRAFAYLAYTRENRAGEIVARDEEIGKSWHTPPYAQDVELQVDVLMAWLNAHRRTLNHLRESEAGHQ